MRRLQAIISTVMLVFLVWSGSAAHAVDPTACAVSASDSAQISADRDDSAPAGTTQKAIHHHGTCHGHCLAAMPDLSSQEAGTDQTVPIFARRVSFDAGADPGRVNRPPIA